jgi:hypothetical protein
MPAHLKASILGSRVSIPVIDGKLNPGTWQGIYFCEYRNDGGIRKFVLTLMGEEKRLFEMNLILVDKSYFNFFYCNADMIEVRLN